MQFGFGIIKQSYIKRNHLKKDKTLFYILMIVKQSHTCK